MTTQYPVAPARQPFAELNSSRLQNLTSIKNRQNATPLSSPSKRKAAEIYEDDDTENVDPVSIFSKFASPKRSKGEDGHASKQDYDFIKPSKFILTPSRPQQSTPIKAAYPVSRRPGLSVSARSSASVTKSFTPLQKSSLSRSSPLSAPAGRSPVHKRTGILNRRKTAGASGSPFTRIDPPSSNRSSSSIPFSLDAALNNTTPSYGSRPLPRKTAPAPLTDTLYDAPAKASWFFEIHEDTESETMTNLMEHSTCILDISSDEESDRRKRDDRGKENIAPSDDISQTSALRIRAADVKDSRQVKIAEGACDVDRAPLGDLKAEEYYAEGLDTKSMVLVLEDESDVTSVARPQSQQLPASDIPTFEFSPPEDIDIDHLMKKDGVALKAAVLQPIEKAEEGFEVWESGSAKGDE